MRSVWAFAEDLSSTAVDLIIFVTGGQSGRVKERDINRHGLWCTNCLDPSGELRTGVGEAGEVAADKPLIYYRIVGIREIAINHPLPLTL
jgi:hypothetical protein